MSDAEMIDHLNSVESHVEMALSYIRFSRSDPTTAIRIYPQIKNRLLTATSSPEYKEWWRLQKEEIEKRSFVTQIKLPGEA